MRLIFRAAGVFGIASLSACGGGDETSTDTGISGLGTTLSAGEAESGGASTGTMEDTGTATTGGPLLDQMGDGSTSTTGDDSGECAAIGSMAENVFVPVDILFAIDTSGSMDDEIGFTQNAMNSFSQQIFLANIDSHVALVASNDVCISVPLGSGMCPADTNLPGYNHVATTVASTNAWQIILNTHPMWSPNFRPGSAMHIVVISDDESAMTAQDFDTQFKALDPTGGYDDYTFHAIVAYDDPSAFDCLVGNYCCDGALDPLGADVGNRYIELAGLTGGITGDLCLQQFGPVFDQIAMAVEATSPLQCEWEIPPPPAGETFDPNKVNVEFDLDGVVETVGWVASEFNCGGGDGWYYYPNNVMPTSIRLCPVTCTRAQAAVDASVEILFGCDTVPVD